MKLFFEQNILKYECKVLLYAPKQSFNLKCILRQVLEHQHSLLPLHPFGRSGQFVSRYFM